MRVSLAQAPTDGGLSCLRMAFAEQRVHVGTEDLRNVSGVGRDAPDQDTLIRTAQFFGFSTKVIDVSQLIESGVAERSESVSMPLVAQWGTADRRYFVLVTRVGPKSIEIIDPFVGRRSLDFSEAREFLRGEGFRVRAEANEPQRKSESPESISRYFVSSRNGTLFLVLAGLGLIVPGVIAPGFVRVFVDDYLARGDRDSQFAVLGGLTAMLILTVTLSAFQLIALRRLNTIAVSHMGSRLMWHLLRMPAWFLTARDATSLGYRVQITQQIAGVLSGELAVALMAVFTSVFFLLVMFILSPILALVSFFGFMTVVLLILRVASERTQVRQRQAREKEVGANLIGTSIRVLDTLKATGNENIAFDRSYSSLGRLLSLGNSHLWAWMGMIPIAVTLFTTVFVLTVGALLVIIGSITQGTLAAFFLLLAGFLAPLVILVPSIDSFLSLRGALEQLDDILLQKVDPALSDPYVDGESEADLEVDVFDALAAKPGVSEGDSAEVKEGEDEEDAEVDYLSLLVAKGGRKRGLKSGGGTGLVVDPWAASLELTNITFGYSRILPPLLSRIDLKISPGRVVALVGASGSGKSTIGRLVASMYQPWEGSIALDGKALSTISQETKAHEINFVNQDVVIFQASIRENISMFNPDIPDRDIVKAAKKALLHDDIVARPGGYESILQEDGKDLSGGQRQRLGIARALVRNPRLLVLDEATSSLDSRTEMEIVKNLRAQGCTSLVIAHRLSTVRDADEIIVMDQGKIVERGTHNSLAANDGPYRKLMDS